jgi:hypothetical protein
MKTKERLAKELGEAGAPNYMVIAALNGDYDDFESKSATPINDLVRECRVNKLHRLANRAMDGEFDGSQEESQEWFEREGKKLLESE